ncbi:hypothetical protein PR003_g20658 [Phytophthora rubi]|uniref:DUF659 domain-containing protein n=2 Tax=Phytophthora rubi TaxID=129364 RepID=A0A6A4DNV7_9STRA|nr:hypothetical protein PR003_g20658 [Phytophthora rubi]
MYFVGALRRRHVVADGVCATAPAPHFRIRFPATSAALAVPLHFTTSTPHQLPRPTSAMPRRHPAWNEFIIVAEATYPDAQCRHCSATLHKCQPSRNMLRHLSSCPQLSDAERTKWSRYGEPATKPKRKRQKRKKPVNPRSPAATQESVMTEMSLSQSQPTTPFSSGVSNADKDRFQAEIARGFYAAGLPFRTIEVPRMRRALTVLQPDMEKYLPNRKALAGRLLTQEYDREKADLIARLRDEPTLGLISDGWTSVNKEKVINYVVVSPLMRPLLWCTRICGEDEQTAEYVASEIGDVIDEINEAAGKAVVVSVTTDNAPVMRKAWEILEAARPIFCNGCSSHALNLILEEVLSIPWMASALSRSVTLVKFIRNRLQLLARFRKLQKAGDEEHRRALRLPVPARWYSSCECIKSVLDNRRTVGKLFRQSKFMKRRFGRRRAVLAEVQSIVADKGFWKRVKLVQTLVEPIVDAIAMLEQDTCCISMVYGQFSQLQLSSVYTERISGVPMNVQSSILASIRAKWRFVHTDTMGISFLLDQTKSTSDFVDNDLAKTVKTIKQLAERIGLVETAAEK